MSCTRTPWFFVRLTDELYTSVEGGFFLRG